MCTKNEDHDIWLLKYKAQQTEFFVILGHSLPFHPSGNLENQNKQEVYEKPIEMSRNNDYTTGNLLDYLYHQKYYKLIGTDLSRQTNISITQQTNFVGKLEKYDGATMFFVSEKQQKTILNFSLDSLIVKE